MKKTKVAIGATIMALLVGIVVPTPALATTENVAGEVNCTGSTVSYATVRKMTGQSIRLDLTKAAGSARGGWLTHVGAHTIANNANNGRTFIGAPNSGYLIQGGYVAGTRFTMYAHMSVSQGACYPNWAGKLGY